MHLDTLLGKVIYIRTALQNNPTDNLDNPHAQWLCEKLIAYDESLRQMLSLIRRIPCDHGGKIQSKDNCARCLTLESVNVILSDNNATTLAQEIYAS